MSNYFIIYSIAESEELNSELYYPMKCYSGNKIGHGIIIVNENFDNPKLRKRKGAQKDQEYFRDIYHKFNIDMRTMTFTMLTLSRWNIT